MIFHGWRPTILKSSVDCTVLMWLKVFWMKGRKATVVDSSLCGLIFRLGVLRA